MDSVIEHVSDDGTNNPEMIDNVDAVRDSLDSDIEHVYDDGTVNP